MNEKSLYLNGNKVLQISLDHQAIKIEHNELSPQWFPLSRLSRLVLFGNIKLDTQLILACMNESIPISFLYSDGKLGALTNAFKQESSSFSLDFQRLYSSLGGQEFVDDWFSAIERQNQIRVTKQLGFNIENYSSDLLIDVFSFYLEGLYKMDDARFVFDLLQNSLLTHLSAFIGKILRINEQNEKLLINTELSHRFMSVLRWKIFKFYLLDNRKYNKTPEKGRLIDFYEKNSIYFESDFFKLANHLYFWIQRRNIDAG